MIRKCIILSSFITSLMLMGCSNKTITNLPSDFRQIDLLDKNKDVVKTYYQSFNDQIYEWINISCEFTKKKFKNINDCKLTEISKSILKKYKDSASPQNSNIDIYPIGALTKKSDGNELAELFEMKNAGAIGFGDYKKSIVNPNMLKLALLYSKDFNIPIFSFPLNKEISNNGVMNESKTSTMLGLKGIPNISEEIQIMRDIRILEYTGGNLHIPYISTGNSLELIKKAKDKGLNISCSTCIHNLFFNDNELSDFNTKFKVLPPLRTQNDVD